MHFVIAIRLRIHIDMEIWHSVASLVVSARGVLTVFSESVTIHALQTDRDNPYG